MANVSCDDDGDPLSLSVLVPAFATVVLNVSKVSTTNTPGTTIEFNARFANTNVVVPEPSTYALMAFGLVGIGFMMRRRRVS